MTLLRLSHNYLIDFHIHHLGKVGHHISPTGRKHGGVEADLWGTRGLKNKGVGKQLLWEGLSCAAQGFLFSKGIP